jgi:hypothetical protein
LAYMRENIMMNLGGIGSEGVTGFTWLRTGSTGEFSRTW